MAEDNGHDEQLAQDMADAAQLRADMRIPEGTALAEGVESVVGNAAQQIQQLQQQTALMGQSLAVLSRLRDPEAPDMLLKLAVALCGKGKSMPTWAEMIVGAEDLRKRAEGADGETKGALADIQKRLAELAVPKSSGPFEAMKKHLEESSEKPDVPPEMQKGPSPEPTV